MPEPLTGVRSEEVNGLRGRLRELGWRSFPVEHCRRFGARRMVDAAVKHRAPNRYHEILDRLRHEAARELGLAIMKSGACQIRLSHQSEPWPGDVIDLDVLVLIDDPLFDLPWHLRHMIESERANAAPHSYPLPEEAA